MGKRSLLACVAFIACSAPVDEPDASPPEDGGTDAHSPIDGGAPAQPSLCDDGNPCTRDHRDESGVCTFEPRSDGAICDDGDLCTLGDRCTSGACVSGARASAPAAVLGVARTFGTTNGGAVLLGDGRALFFDSPDNRTSFTLARLGDGVEVLDSLMLDQPSLLDERRAPAASLGGDLVALVDSFRRDLYVISTEGDAIEVRARIALSDGAQPIAMAGDSERLWICSVDFFRGGIATIIDVSDPGAPAEVGTIDFGGEGCGTVALSDDGERAYIATSSGIRLFDARSVPPIEAGIVGPPAIVSVHGDRLALHTGEGAQIFSEPELESIATISIAAYGARLTDHGLVVEGARDTASGTDAFVALYAIEDASLIDEVIVQRSPFRFTTEIEPIMADGSRLVHSFSRRIFETTGEGLRELSPPVSGNIDYVDGRGGQVVARNRHASMRFDMSDVSAPLLISGGVGARSPQLLLELPEASEMRLWDDVNARSIGGTSAIEIYPFRTDVVIDRAQFGEDETRTELGTVELPRGHAWLRTVGDALYRVSMIDTGRARLERWDRDSLTEGSEPAPELAIDLVPDEPIEFPNDDARVSFDVDPRARRVLVALGRPNGNDSESRLLVIDLEDRSVRSLSVGGLVSQAALAGNRIAYVEGLELVFVEIGEELREVSRGTIAGGQFMHGLLAFDGRAAYVAYFDGISAVPFGATVESFSYRVPGYAMSLARIDGGIVVATAIEATVLAPWCPL